MDDRTVDAPVESASSTSRGPAPRFLPGAMLDRRYRIVAPLGRGGMGDVYRADDLKLGSPVALKFLPPEIERDAGRRAMLLDEVNLARQVSHPHVCRVWDAGEADGLHFVAMEYVDGEDLASLLRRIGRMPEERGVQIAREVCAGLAAIHDQGLLHRDLKPANILIDGRGRVRIADFGLAALSQSVTGQAAQAGTPAYMAPEQLAGREATPRSDIYALGLVLFELFTGHHAFASQGTPLARGADSHPDAPTTHVRSLDPLIERAILRCLDNEPASRPANALAVAAALPGGDPVRAALAAGETPSPEMVAASGGDGGMRPLVAAGCVLASAALFIGALALSDLRGLPFGADDKPYDVLRDRAAEFLRARGGLQDGEYIADGYARLDASGGDARSESGAVFYWCRRAPRPVPYGIDERDPNGTRGFEVPALDQPGERLTRYDLTGRLLEYRRVPSAADSASGALPEWAPYFAAAGLDDAPRTDAVPANLPLVPADVRTAWTVRTAAGTQRVEAASYRGAVTFFRVGDGPKLAQPTRGDFARTTLFSVAQFGLFAWFLLLARRNLFAGRADVRGAWRLGVLNLVLGALGFGVLPRTHIDWPGTLALASFTASLFFALFLAVAYLALEPVVRRSHPAWLASWTRLMDGRLRDGLVGRDVLFGLTGGLLITLLGEAAGKLLGTAPYGDYQAAAVGGGPAWAVVLRGLSVGLLGAMIACLLQALAARVVRLPLLAWSLWTLALATFFFGRGADSVPWLAVNILKVALLGMFLTRVGVLGVMVALFVHATLNEEYLTLHMGAWYGGVTRAAMLACAAVAAWGCWAALRPSRRRATD